MTTTSRRITPQCAGYGDRLEAAAPFYKIVGGNQRLSWLDRSFADADGFPMQGAVQNYRMAYKDAILYDVIRIVLIGFAFIGYCALIVALYTFALAPAFKEKSMVSLIYVLMLGALIAVGFGVAVPWLFKKMTPLIESYIVVYWTHADFEATVNLVDSVRPDDAYPITWMECNGTEQGSGSIPEHVIKVCDEALVGLALQYKYLEKDRRADAAAITKRQFNELLAACRRLGIIGQTVHPKIFWEEADRRFAAESIANARRAVAS